MIRRASDEWPTREEQARLPTSKFHAAKLRLRAQGRAQCIRCDGSGIHGSPTLMARVCGACFGKGYVEAPPIRKAGTSKGFGAK